MLQQRASSALSSSLRALGILCLVLGQSTNAIAYPIDEHERTGIRRLKWQYGVDVHGRRGRKMVVGGRWPGKSIELRMLAEGNDFELTPETPKHPELQKALEQVLKKWSWRRYNIAILDITDPAKPRYAGVNDHTRQTPGSVAKVLVGAAMLEMLKQRWPDDIAKREELLRTHEVTADDWSLSDSHVVPFVVGEELDRVSYRKIRPGHTFTLWEWMDHALSASNNSAASTVWREAALMKLMGETYPPSAYGKELWKRWDRDAMTEASFAVVDKALTDAGLSLEDFRLRLYFTSGANRYIRSSSSYATPHALIKWMVRVEQGRMVDRFSSLELKKMLYLTRRRVRYLYTHKLDNYGAWFKSGSLYRFSENAERIQYQGDIINVLNSLIEIDTRPPLPLVPPEPPSAPSEQATVTAAVVESGDGGGDVKASSNDQASAETEAQTDTTDQKKQKQDDATTEEPPKETPKEETFVYIVAVMSNELKRNAALDHSKLAEAIHDIIVETSSPKNEPSEKGKEKDPGA